jgi:hypothetical protein
MADQTKTARGRVVLVQEQTFRLVTPDGKALHLTLSVYGRPFPWGLTRYRDARTEVEVEYEGEPGTTTARAHSVRPVIREPQRHEGHR